MVGLVISQNIYSHVINNASLVELVSRLPLIVVLLQNIKDVSFDYTNLDSFWSTNILEYLQFACF